MGVSFGAVVALTKAYSDERIKAIVSIVGLSNCKENFSRKPNNLEELFILKMLKLSGLNQIFYLKKTTRLCHLNLL